MKHMKNTFSVLLAFVMILCLLPAGLVMAENEAATATLGDYTFEVDSDGNYLIQSEEDWNNLSEAVRADNTCQGLTFLQTEDISVTRPIGGWKNNAKKYFCGTYDGGNHTLTVTLSSKSSYFKDNNSNYCSPFPYTQNATVRNLRVEGTITTAKKYAAGLIGAVEGNGTISNVTVAVTLSSSMSGDGTDGGVVAIVESNSTCTITGVTFCGSLLSTGNEPTIGCGGFVAFNKHRTYFDSCVFAPQEVTFGDGAGTNLVCDTLARSGSSKAKATYENCYYTETLGTVAQSGVSQAYENGELPSDGTLLVATEVNGMTIYVPQHQSFVGFELLLTGSLGLIFDVHLPEGVSVDDCEVTFSITGKGSVVSGPVASDTTHYDEENDVTYYGFTCFVNSLQMADTITATLHTTVDGKDATATRSYSVKRYLDYVLAHSSDFTQETVDLVSALADYGHYVQAYLSVLHGFGLGDGDDQYAEMTTYRKEMTTSEISTAQNATEPYAIVRPTTDDIAKIAFGLAFDSDSSISVYFTPKKGYEGAFTSTPSATDKNGRYEIRFTDIPATGFAITREIPYTTDGGSQTVRVSVLSYANALFGSDKAYAKEAAAATYYYYAAATAYKQAEQG